LLAALRDQMKADRQRHDGFHAGLKAAAAGTWSKEQGATMKKEEKRIVEAVVGLLRDNQQLEEDHGLMREENAQLQAEHVHLERGVQERDKVIAHYEFAAQESDEDDRLRLYRQIVAAYEDDKDVSELVDQVRELERVFILDQDRQTSLHKVLDRQLESIAQELGDFRKIIPLTEDPKRYRPRLLGSSPYKLKTLIGVMQALRDASRDLALYVEKARWSFGLKILSREFKSLRRIFKEMIKLVADVREKNGDAPPLSSTISVDLNSGIAAIPAVLSKDIDGILRSKGASRYAIELQSIFEEVLTAYHASLEKATGASIMRAAVPKRESAVSAMRRLNDELLQLSSEMEQHFADAAVSAYELPPAEAELQERMVELALSVRNVDSACEILAALDTAPKADFGKLPSGKGKDADRLYRVLGERIVWLEEVARYRIEAPLV
ncbi:MAG: hypothetical protein HRU15_20005, partial [Planctomycetes bacterium]|nr:hypothetical protein [Planctomycetota bacterium]